MDQNTLYRDIAGRCGGDIYLGVVGPVRTGKSTFIKRFMELLVLPNLAQDSARDRTVDALPQSGAGRTIMTTQPRFVPDEAVEVQLREGAMARVRLVDCVGYLIPGVLGLSEDGDARMVRTPWFDHDIPFEEAAELGTRRVIREHSTIGMVVTTDGSVVDMPRSAYEAAETRVIGELKALGKPFIIILNVKAPNSPDTRRLVDSLTRQHGVPVHAVNVQEMRMEDLNGLLESLLFEFPIREVRIQTPAWLTALADDHWLGRSVLDTVREAAGRMRRVRDHSLLMAALNENEYAEDVLPAGIDLNTGALEYRLSLKDGLFYRVLGEACGENIEGEAHLFTLMKQLVSAKRSYDRVAGALEQAQNSGYGVVTPALDELALQPPELSKQGSQYGVRLRAAAPSLHLIRADIRTEVNPFAGSQSQSEELARSLKEKMEVGGDAIWETEIFGKTLSDLVREGISGKLNRLPEDARQKLRQALEKVINEGSGGMICIML